MVLGRQQDIGTSCWAVAARRIKDIFEYCATFFCTLHDSARRGTHAIASHILRCNRRSYYRNAQRFNMATHELNAGSVFRGWQDDVASCAHKSHRFEPRQDCALRFRVGLQRSTRDITCALQTNFIFSALITIIEVERVWIHPWQFVCCIPRHASSS